MATLDEQNKLIEVLKFTPRTYRISLWGYGGEYVMGTVDREVYDYFKKRRLSVSDYAWDSDNEYEVPDELQPFPPGSWYECDNMCHASGVDRNSGTLQVSDENGNDVYTISLENIDGYSDGSPEISCSEEVWIDEKDPGTVVFIGVSGEKGTFFEGDIELNEPFDSSKLTVYYDEIDGNEIVTQVEYDGVEIDNEGANTNGKSSDFGFYIAGSNKNDGTGWERYKDMDDIKYSLTDWFPGKTLPVREGVYNIKTKDGYSHQGKWTGTRWITSWAEDKPDTESIKVKEWQGIDHNPEEE